jgi:hypothetical protein
VSDETTIDLPAGGSAALPQAGERPARIKDARPHTSKSSGKPSICVEIRAWIDEEQRWEDVTCFLPLSVPFRVKNFVGVVLPEHKGGPFDLETLADREIRVRLSIEEFEGEPRLRVDRFLAPNPDEPAPAYEPPESKVPF